MARRRTRRQAHGSAWHWKQTDSWYYTLPGSKQRVPLFDPDGNRIRGKDNNREAELALARVKLGGGWKPEAPPTSANDWLVARVCSEYLQYCERGVAHQTLSQGHHEGATWVLNDLCQFCGALPVAELQKGHIQTWIGNHPRWQSPVTHRSVISIVLAAFNYVQDNFRIANPLQGLKKPPARPRLHSFTRAEEEAVYGVTDEPFRNFLFAAIHTGLRPFCELARLTAEDIVESERGLMWRVYSSKTRKTRKIPVRAEVAELTRKLMRTAPAGSGKPLFRNPQGNAWKKVTGVARFVNIRKQLGWDQDPVRRKYSCYTSRHTFAHRMLAGYWNGGVGCSIETLAELIGDTPKVAFDHYGKEWGQHYQEPLWAAIGAAEPSPGKRSGPSRPKRRKKESATSARHGGQGPATRRQDTPKGKKPPSR